MATKRAMRLEQMLSELGWDTGVDEMACPKCNRSYSSGVYCQFCGCKVKPASRRAVMADLEHAIAYALGEVNE